MKKEQDKYSPDHDSFEFRDEQATFCCGLFQVGGFYAEHYDVDWSKPLSRETLALWKRRLPDQACVATTVGRRRPATRSMNVQDVANLLLPKLGFRRVATFRGNTGRQLWLWFKPKTRKPAPRL